MKNIIIFILVLGVSFAHEASLTPSIIKRIEDKYNYRDWSEDEYRMLRILLHVGHHHGPLNDDDKFIIDEKNQVLRVKIAKEVFLTEDLSDANSAHIVVKAGKNFHHGYTSREILDFAREYLPNAGKLVKSEGKVTEINILKELQLILWVQYYGTTSDLDILDYIQDNIESNLIRGRIEYARTRVEKKRISGIRSLTEYEKSKKDSSLKNVPGQKKNLDKDGIKKNSNRTWIIMVISLIVLVLGGGYILFRISRVKAS